MKIYKQKLRDVWLQMEEFRPWLRRDPDDSYRAHCRFCKCCVNTKISDLRAHATTKKHMRHLELRHPHLARTTDQGDESQLMNASTSSSTFRTPKKASVPRVKKEPASVKKEKFTRPEAAVDYEQIIENLALYEPEQVMFSNCSINEGEQHLEDEIEGHDNEMSMVSIVDEDMVNKAVANALSIQRDSSQVFGDFVADRLRQLNSDAAEFAKDKIMKVILEAASIERAL